MSNVNSYHFRKHDNFFSESFAESSQHTHDSFYQTCLFLNEVTLWSYQYALALVALNCTYGKNGDVIGQFLFKYDNFLFESFVETSQDICQLSKSKFLPMNNIS